MRENAENAGWYLELCTQGVYARVGAMYVHVRVALCSRLQKQKTVCELERSLADPADAAFFLPRATALSTVQAVHAVVRGVLGGIRGDSQPGHAARGAALLVERPVRDGRRRGRDQQHDVTRGDDQSPGVERPCR